MMTLSASANRTCLIICLFVVESLVLAAPLTTLSIRNYRVINFVQNAALIPNLKLQGKDNVGNRSSFNDNDNKDSVSSFSLPLYILDETLNGTSAQTSVKHSLLLIKQIPMEQDNTQFVHKEQVNVSGDPSNHNYNTKVQSYVSSNFKKQNYNTKGHAYVFSDLSNLDYSTKGEAYTHRDHSKRHYTGQAYISGEPYNQNYKIHSPFYSNKDFSGKNTILHSYTSTLTLQEALSPTISSNSPSAKISELWNKNKVTQRNELRTHISRASERSEVSNIFIPAYGSSQVWDWFPSNASIVISNNHKPPGSVYPPPLLTKNRPSTYYKPVNKPLTLINHHNISSYGPHNLLQSLESSTNRTPSLTVLKPLTFANEKNTEYNSDSSPQVEAVSQNIFYDAEQPSISLLTDPADTPTAIEIIGELIKGPDLITSIPILVNDFGKNDTRIKTSVTHEGLITVAYQGEKNETTYSNSPVLDDESDRNVSSSEPFSINELYSQIFTSTEGGITSEKTNIGSYNVLSASAVNPSSVVVPSPLGVFVPSSSSSFLTLSSLIKPPSLMSLFRFFLLSIMIMMVPSALTGMSMVASALMNNG